jgi:hypothetical protein
MALRRCRHVGACTGELPRAGSSIGGATNTRCVESAKMGSRNDYDQRRDARPRVPPVIGDWTRGGIGTGSGVGRGFARSTNRHAKPCGVRDGFPVPRSRVGERHVRRACPGRAERQPRTATFSHPRRLGGRRNVFLADNAEGRWRQRVLEHPLVTGRGVCLELDGKRISDRHVDSRIGTTEDVHALVDARRCTTRRNPGVGSWRLAPARPREYRERQKRTCRESNGGDRQGSEFSSHGGIAPSPYSLVSTAVSISASTSGDS